MNSGSTKQISKNSRPPGPRITLWIFLIALSATLSITSCTHVQEAEVFSPNGNIRLYFNTFGQASTYSVFFNGKEIIKPSAMGFDIKDAEPLHDKLAMMKMRKRTIKETWTPVWGETSEITNHYNELTVHLVDLGEVRRQMNIIFRVYNDGIGFRYEIPKQEHINDFEITSERTEFCFADDHTSWWIPANFDSYEQTYTQSPLSEVGAVNTPLTMETSDGICISIHEANLTDYAGMTLRAAQDKEFAFDCNLVPWPDGSKVKTSAPMVTPWRTIQISDHPGGLIESNLIINLNEPNVIKDTSWIRPMKYIGIWWGMHIKKYTWHEGPDHGATTEI
ncbi:MAG: glycoside hydrolase family 97 N-terminal domain-containing protein, partial [Candidatus Latescibacterota bacterium]